MDLRVGTEEAGSDLKIPHNLPHCSPLSPFLFARISPQYLHVFALRSIVFLCHCYYIYGTWGNTWQILSPFFIHAMHSRLIKC